MNSGGATFQYDPFGRRVAKTTILGTTNYLYDGLNPIQELAGTIPTANLMTGGIDEYFQRTDSNGPANFLADATGSTLALTDPSGNTLAQYTYEPFGNTTITGTSANPYQYTGRENDGTGVYLYRARYYSPTVQRFISEDPFGFTGGINLYAYVGESPANFIDPLGLNKNNPMLGYHGPPYLPSSRFRQWNPNRPGGPYPPNEGPPAPADPPWPTEPPPPLVPPPGPIPPGVGPEGPLPPMYFYQWVGSVAMTFVTYLGEVAKSLPSSMDGAFCVTCSLPGKNSF